MNIRESPNFDKIFIFEGSYECFSLKFEGTSGEIANKIFRKIGIKIFISLPGNSCYIKGNLAKPSGSYGVAKFHFNKTRIS